jgi:hypothetical protein
MRRLLACGALLCAALGCSKPKTDAAAPSASGVASAAPVVSHVVTRDAQSSASAFELVARTDGLRVLWASAAPGLDWVHEVELGQDGAPRAAARQLRIPAHTLGKVTDLSAAVIGDQLVLAWLEQGEREARAQGAWLASGASQGLLDLGPAALVAEAARGNIAIAPEAERLRALVLWRGLEAPCVNPQQSPCTGFAFRRLTPTSAETTGLPLSVPVPCASHSVELATAPGRFFYGVCTREGAEPVTTMFTIQYDPEYARAEPLLKGCVPLGTIDVEGRPWLVADCHGKRQAAPVPLMDERVAAEDLDRMTVSCTPQQLELRRGKLALTLRQPRAGLEAIVPPALAPTGARVGWTGTTLIALFRAGDALETRAYACREGKLQALP